METKTYDRHKIIATLLFFINIVVITLFNVSSLLSLGYTTILFLLFNRFFTEKKLRTHNFFAFQVLLFVTLVIYTSNLIAWPDFLGLTPNIRGVGTDDAKFYAGVTDNIHNLPESAAYYSYWRITNVFSNFLKVLYPFPIYHPLTILIPNILGLSFIPYFTYKVALKASSEEKVAKLAFILVLFCPMLIINGAILMRDGWTAFFTIVSIYYAQEKKIIPFLIAIVLLSYLRISTGILVFVCSLLIWNKALFENRKNRFRFIGLLLIVIVSLSFFLPLISDYIQTENISFGRDSFVESFIGEDSTAYKLYMLPLYLRIPASFIFFFSYPYLSLESITSNAFDIRGFLTGIIMPLLFIVYFRYMISGIVYSFIQKNAKDIKTLVIILFVFIAAISMISLQLRHRTAIMPLYYILIAYGFYNNKLITRQIGGIYMVCYIMIQIVFLF